MFLRSLKCSLFLASLPLVAAGCGDGSATDEAPLYDASGLPSTIPDGAVADAGSGLGQGGGGGDAALTGGGALGGGTSDAGAPPASDASLPMEAAAADAASDDDAAAQPDAGDDAAVVPSAGPKPKCVQKDSQVMVIGDSYINWISHSFPDQLKTATKMDWRMLAVGGYSMGSGGIGSIPAEWDDSIAQDPDAHTVLMDGGGNDVLIADIGIDPLGACKDTGSSMNPDCQKIIDLAIQAASDLMDRMAAAGIRDVVYFFYPHIPEGRSIGGPHPNEILDYALPMVEDFCNGAEGRTSGKLRCTFISMIPVFEGHIPGFDGVTAGSAADFFNGDIHPNDKGSQAMVDKVWQVMTDKCIGQKAKDCCEP